MERKGNKELLLKDLCGRLPYEVKAWEDDECQPFTIIGYDGADFIDNDGWEHRIGRFKPYLRQMSSMTEEERKEFEKVSHCFLKTIVLKRDRKCRIVEQKAYFDNEIPSYGAFGDSGDCRYIKQEYFVNLIDWLNEHHFDYHGLIEKGLAIAVTEKNNPYERMGGKND